QRVPRDLAVVVGVEIDEPGRDEQAVGVDGAVGAALVEAAHAGDDAVVDGHVGRAGVAAGAVDDRAAADHEVVHGPGLRCWYWALTTILAWTPRAPQGLQCATTSSTLRRCPDRPPR